MTDRERGMVRMTRESVDEMVRALCQPSFDMPEFDSAITRVRAFLNFLYDIVVDERGE